MTIFTGFLAENDWEIIQKKQSKGLLEMFLALATVLIFENSFLFEYLHIMLKLKRFVALNLSARI